MGHFFIKIALAIAVMVTGILISDHTQLSKESYHSETLQAIVIFIATALAFAQLKRIQSSQFWVGLLFSMVGVAFFLREVEPLGWGLTGFLLWMLDDDGRYIIAIPLVLALSMVLLNIKSHWATRKEYLATPLALWSGLCLFFLVLAIPFDKHVFGLSYGPAIEEASELFGYCFFTYASLSLKDSLNLINKKT